MSIQGDVVMAKVKSVGTRRKAAKKPVKRAAARKTAKVKTIKKATRRTAGKAKSKPAAKKRLRRVDGSFGEVTVNLPLPCNNVTDVHNHTIGASGQAAHNMETLDMV